jgi:hypothetical protein
MKKNAMNSLLSLVRKTNGYRQARQLYINQYNFSSNIIWADFKAESELDRAITLAAKSLAASDCKRASPYVKCNALSHIGLIELDAEPVEQMGKAIQENSVIQ